MRIILFIANLKLTISRSKLNGSISIGIVLITARR